MTSKDAIELAYKNADIAAKNIQFFLVASVAIGGWIITSGELKGTEPFSVSRIFWAVLYLAISFVAGLVHVLAIERVNSSFALARALATNAIKDNPDFLVVTKPSSKLGTYLGFPALVLLVIYLILAFTKTGIFPF